MSGPLDGIRVVEFAGLGPAPFATMALADLGAEVIRIDRVGAPAIDPNAAALDVLIRNRPTIGLDLKHPSGVAVARELLSSADVMIEGFRPGVLARLGLGADELLAANPRLVIGQMTGWGQQGPLAQRAGHDLTYASVAGAIAHIGRRDQPPTPPLNLVADFGGGAMLLVNGILAALVERSVSGKGQIVDAAMVDGVALLMAPFYGAYAANAFSTERGTNLLDSGAPFYDCYRCADDEYVAVAAIEPQFFAALIDGLGLDESWRERQHDEGSWDDLRTEIGTAIATRSRRHWDEHFASTDACVAPVLRLLESVDHPHIAARHTVVDVEGVPHPRPAPRFSRSDPALPTPGRSADGDDAAALLDAFGVSPGAIGAATDAGALR